MTNEVPGPGVSSEHAASPTRGTSRRWLPWFVPGIGVGLYLFELVRFYRRFIYDDASGRVWGLADDVYISACFGRTLFSGNGFLWYPGAPRIEGISNPLWSLAIGAFHTLPGFEERKLGLFVLLANALLLCGACAMFWRSARSLWPDEAETSGSTWLTSLACFATTAALAYWSAEGYEVALVAVLSFALVVGGLRLRRPKDAAWLGVLLALGLATRMDFALVAIPGVAALLRNDARTARRSLAVLAATTCALVLALLLVRHAYYGDFLPNTYYLKATGWPLSDRVRKGLEQDPMLVLSAVAVWAPLVLPSIRRTLSAQLPLVVAAWLSFSLTVAYSVSMGGDSWKLYLGYDRHTVVGGLLLAWGLSLFVAAHARARRLVFAAASLWSLSVAALPVLTGARSMEQLTSGLFASQSPTRDLERKWIVYGRDLEQVSLPKARIAVCPAGAIIYFSHRGGVDLLGKVDPLVAHLPVLLSKGSKSRCWQNAPGHNKGDDLAMFKLRTPDLSRYEPPRAVRDQYVKAWHGQSKFYARRGSPLVLWDRIDVKAAQARPEPSGAAASQE